MNIKYLFTGLLVLLFVGKGFGQDSLIYSLDYFIELAIKNNYDIKIARNDSKIATNNATRSNAGLMPKVSLSGNYSVSSNDTKAEFTGELPSSDESGAKTTMYGGSIDLSRTIFNGFYAINKYRKLKEQAELSDIVLKTEIENTIVAVSNAYYNYISIENDLAIAKENYVISKERLQKINDNLDFGQSSENEKLNTLSALNADSVQILTLENNKQRAFVDLIKYLGTDSISNKAQYYSSDELLLLDYNQLHQALEQNNTMLKQSQTYLGISQLEYKMAKASRFPKLNVNASYGFNKQEYDVGVMTLNQTLGVTFGATLSYDLFTFGKKRKDIQNSKISLENQQLSLEKVELQITQDFNKAWNDYQFRLNSIEIEKSNLKIEKERFERTKNNYYLGQTDNLSFRDAQLSLARAKSNLFNAKINGKIAELELLRISGTLLVN